MNQKEKLAKIGKPAEDIPVTISYHIIEHFSAGLYSSPNKAIEELIANSYDAMADTVHVLIPFNSTGADEVIWVADNGRSMDKDGLFDLWKIGVSRKRELGQESPERPPIGRFGIGKLATYVLAKQLTYICKADGLYRAVTMDFNTIRREPEQTDLKLKMRNLTEKEAREIVLPILEGDFDSSGSLKLFGKSSAPSWTIAAMSDLTSLAQQLSPGRLRWVLSTALPLSPAFRLFLNSAELESSKLRMLPLKTWTIGESDKVAQKEAEKLGLETKKGEEGIFVAGLGQVTGTAELYEDPLTGDKSEHWGRSHGIFVIVRKRLINLDDALFGLPQLSHGPFSRFRMVLYADGLDPLLRATRETVLQSESVTRLRQYLLAKFNEIRIFYNEWQAHEDFESRIKTRIGFTPQSLSRRPLLNAIKSATRSEEPFQLTLTDLPPPGASESLIKMLEHEIQSETGLIKGVELEAGQLHLPIARYDPTDGIVYVNSLHPFYSNYADSFQSPEPFELLAVTEVLTEAYLLEEQIPADSVRNLILRRDRFLRELVYSRQLAAPLVAEFLNSAATDPDQLERAVEVAFQSLGFEVARLGGKNKPDGIARARLGVRDAEGHRADYTITYDAKSTHKDRIAGKEVVPATIVRHRKRYEADFAVVIAPGFQGGEDETSKALTEARQQEITLFTITDMRELVLLAASRQLGLTKLRELFAKCRTPREVHKWISKVANEPVPEMPLADVLEAIYELQDESPDPVKFAAVRMQRRTLRRYREAELRAWVESVRRLAGGYVTVSGDIVSLEAPPEKILEQVRLQGKKLPSKIRKQSTFRRFLKKKGEA
jgi:hypothetical protein